jgi:hypothetical protein
MAVASASDNAKSAYLGRVVSRIPSVGKRTLISFIDLVCFIQESLGELGVIHSWLRVQPPFYTFCFIWVCERIPRSPWQPSGSYEGG